MTPPIKLLHCAVCIFRDPRKKGNKIRSGCLTPAFSGAQNRVEMLCHPYILVDCESLTPTQGATQQSGDCESLTPTQGATQQSMDCDSLTPTQGATQQSVDCESLTPTQGATQQSVDSEIAPVSSIASKGWGPTEGGNATSPLHSRGSPTKGTKSEVKTYARGHHDAPSISKYGSLVQRDAQIAALRYVCPLSATPRRPPVGHGSQKMPGASPAR